MASPRSCHCRLRASGPCVCRYSHRTSPHPLLPSSHSCFFASSSRGSGISNPESVIAFYLSSLQRRVKEMGIQVGSYRTLHMVCHNDTPLPLSQQGVCVSLIGRNDDTILEIAKDVEAKVDGRIVPDEELERWRKEARESVPLHHGWKKNKN